MHESRGFSAYFLFLLRPRRNRVIYIFYFFFANDKTVHPIFRTMITASVKAAGAKLTDCGKFRIHDSQIETPPWILPKTVSEFAIFDW